MRVRIGGAGAWGPGFSSFDQYRQVLQECGVEAGDTQAPKPELIPARERRRSPVMVKLAVEVAAQACAMAHVEPGSAQCVFSSGIGDAELTDYMCRVLAGPDKLLSPTKFHNSVHNAAVGYWSISTGCEQAATFVSSLSSSFSSSLMEAMVQVTAEQKPVLLVLSDIPIPAPMHAMHPIDHMFGAAFLLKPEGADSTNGAAEMDAGLSLQLAPEPGEWPANMAPGLRNLYQSSPAAKAMCLLDALCNPGTQQMNLPLSAGLSVQISVQAGA